MNRIENSPPPQPIEILLVEDDLADIKLTRRALECERFTNRVHVVRDGIEAMKFLRHEAEYRDAPVPDIMLLDLNLPRMDGREVLREVKSDPALRSLPVVVLTTSEDDADVQRSYLEYANSYITKPVNVDHFTKAVLGVTEYWFTIVKLPRKKKR